VAAQDRENVEGEKTARKAVGSIGRKDEEPDSARAVRLWRGAKGYERIVQGV
jgi:hypothetical protein